MRGILTTETSLTLVAACFIVSGIVGVVGPLAQQGEDALDVLDLLFTVFYVFLGIGLLLRNPQARRAASAWVGLGLFILPLAALWVVFAHLFGIPSGLTSSRSNIFLMAIHWLFYWWQHRVLTAPRTLAIFRMESLPAS